MKIEESGSTPKCHGSATLVKDIANHGSVQVRSARAVEDLQRKELEDQLEAEAYFSGLYKTQVLPGTSGTSGYFRIRFPYPYSTCTYGKGSPQHPLNFTLLICFLWRRMETF